jgi:hypothetical protein
MRIVWAVIGPTGAAENSKDWSSQVGRLGGGELGYQMTTILWGAIYEKCGSKEGFVPIFERHGGMR